MIKRQEQIVLNIPHSSTYIPNDKGYNKALIQGEINLLTDWFTDVIFDIPNIDRLVATFSRCYCDVERLPDHLEEMSKKGMGWYYTMTDSGERFCDDSEPMIKEIVWKNTYVAYHKALIKKIKSKLAKHDKALIIDCHSFTDKPLIRDDDQTTPRPDICIGTDAFHTPANLIKTVVDVFEENGYLVKINSPYAGTMMPLVYYKKNSAVQSIMIEINRKLYIDKNLNPLPGAIKKLNSIIGLVIKNIATT